MYSVGIIDPDGMLKGAATKLRRTQARIASVRMKRAVLAVPLRAFEGEASTCSAARAETGRFIPAACVRAMAHTSRRHSGWHLPVAPLCAASMANQQQQARTATLEELFKAEPDRLSRLSFEVAGLYFDLSKTHLDGPVVERFLARAEEMGFDAARDALFSGQVVNLSEGRPATHVAERGSGAPEDV